MRRVSRSRAFGMALTVALGTGCAGVDPFGPQPLAGAAQSAVMGRGQVDVRLDPDGTALVSGWVEDRISERSVLREVAARAEVRRVVDLIRVEDWYR